tara:strand:+ start:154 stop:345 length:192 start_codon:yes stop_codon:yes gene_type:complete
MTSSTQPMSLTDIKDRLKDERLLLVADATGISYPTINKLAKGEVGNYSLKTILAVSKHLKSKI